MREYASALQSLLELPMGLELPPSTSIIQNAFESGPVSIAAAAVILLSGVLLVTWLVLAVRHRQLFPVLPGAAATLLAVGYRAYDREYLSLNLALRDAPAAQADCIALCERI